jgi:hypothetical protein
MHTSSGVDNIDEYLETIVQAGLLLLQIRLEERKVVAKKLVVPHKTANGMAQRN